jgi:hypothetical protein
MIVMDRWGHNSQGEGRIPLSGVRGQLELREHNLLKEQGKVPCLEYNIYVGRDLEKVALVSEEGRTINLEDDGTQLVTRGELGEGDIPIEQEAHVLVGEKVNQPTLEAEKG